MLNTNTASEIEISTERPRLSWGFEVYAERVDGSGRVCLDNERHGLPWFTQRITEDGLSDTIFRGNRPEDAIEAMESL